MMVFDRSTSIKYTVRIVKTYLLNSFTVICVILATSWLQKVVGIY